MPAKAWPRSVTLPRCVFYFLKCCGLAPISYSSEPADRFHKTPRFAESRLGAAYNCLLLLVLTSRAYFDVLEGYSVEFEGRRDYERLADSVQCLVLDASVLFVLGAQLARQAGAAAIGNALVVEYPNCEPGAWCSDIRAVLLVKLVLLGLWLLSSCTIWFTSLAFYTSTCFCNLVISTTLLQYSLVLKLTCRLFRAVNIELLGLCEDQPPDLGFVRGYALRSRLDRLARLRERYVCLCKIADQLSEFYAAPMLFCVANTFLTLTIYTYYIVKPIVVEVNNLPAMSVVHCAMQVLYSMVPLVILTRTATATIREGKRTGEIACEHVGKVENLQIVNQLNNFIPYCICKNIKFCVSNFFPLNESLLLSIIGSITTYLVILLQFNDD